MQIALSYHQGDKDQADRWLSWCAELGGVNRHQLFIMPAKGAGPVDAHAAAWNRVEFIPDSYGVVSNWNASDPIRDASGPNSMFRQFAWFFMSRAKGPWMFIEPDAIPMRSTWADEFEAAYIKAVSMGKPYMGAIIPGVTNEYATHATGNGVYPETAAYNEGLMIPQYAKWGQTTIEIAFDVASAKAVLNQFASTPLIQQIFRGKPFEKMEDLSVIRPETAVFHNDKTFSMLPFLRQKLGLLPGPIEMPELLTSRAQCFEDENGMAVAEPKGPAESVFPSGMGEVVNKNLLACHKTLKPVVHTYCAWSSDAEYRAEQEKVVSIWRENWTAAGWEPRVLTEDDARKHPEYERFRKGFAALPIKNPMEYEMACLNRHVAMSVCGAGFMVDYDCLNNGFSPDSGWGISKARIFCGHVPCAILATADQYETFAKAFILDKAQSDMHWFEAHKETFHSSDICREYGTPHWQSDASLIHFAHYACRPRKRSEVMSEWMAEKDKPVDLSSLLEKSVEVVKDVKYHVSALTEMAAANPLAKARIVMQLTRAGFIKSKSKTKAKK